MRGRACERAAASLPPPSFARTWGLCAVICAVRSWWTQSPPFGSVSASASASAPIAASPDGVCVVTPASAPPAASVSAVSSVSSVVSSVVSRAASVTSVTVSPALSVVVGVPVVSPTPPTPAPAEPVTEPGAPVVVPVTSPDTCACAAAGISSATAAAEIRYLCICNPTLGIRRSPDDLCIAGRAVPGNAAGCASCKTRRELRRGVYVRFRFARPRNALRLGECGRPCEVARMTRPRPRAILAAAFAALLALTAPAQACTVEAGYRAPTNLELAAHADAIVLGQLTGGSGVALPESTISVRPLAAIKGVLPGQDFKLAGMSVAADVPPSDPQELEAPHP